MTDLSRIDGIGRDAYLAVKLLVDAMGPSYARREARELRNRTFMDRAAFDRAHRVAALIDRAADEIGGKR